MNSLKDEVKFLFSGQGMPYEKVCIMIAMVISVILSVLLNGNFAKDAPVAVIDLDNSKYSQELITKINASEYMQVKDIIYMPIIFRRGWRRTAIPRPTAPSALFTTIPIQRRRRISRQH